jgi:uncharacterized damage-inducible protein DinB
MESPLDAELLQIVRARLLDDYPRQVRACLQALGDEEIWWRPNEQSNAVGNLVLHVAGSNRHYLEHVIGGGADVRNREAEFAARGGRSRVQIEDLYEDVTGIVRGVLETLTPARLIETTERTGRASSFARILLHVTHHNSVHIGQIVWITKMVRPQVIADLARTPASPPSQAPPPPT